MLFYIGMSHNIPMKRMSIFIVFVMLFALGVPQYAVEKDTTGTVDTVSGGPLLQDWLGGQLRIWASPFKVKKKSLLFLGGLALTTAYLIKRDRVFNADARNFAADHQWVRKSSPIITRLGSTPVNLGLIGSLYLGGVLLKDDRARNTARLSLKSLMHAVVVSQVLKRVFRRQRPYVDSGVDRWFNPGKGTDYHSFPSGHTTAAWSVATVIAGMYKDKPAVPVVCYSLATLTGLSRMTENKHWASDVLVGAVLGYAIGRFVLKKNIRNFHVSPMLYSDRLGVSVSYIF